MRIGLQISYFSWPDPPRSIGPTMASLGRNAEEAGFESLWVMDHFFQIPAIGPPESEMLEAYSTLSFVAGATGQIGLGAMVTGVTYRHPGVLLKTVTTLDVLSGGRAWLGIGAAWSEEEHRGLGIPYPPLGERFERLEETLQIAQRMWSGSEEAFEGKHYRLERPLNSPQAISQPHPPILVGGGGEKKTLRLVAQYADACNIFDGGVDFVRGKYEVLRGHCVDLGRDYDEITKSVLSRITLAPEPGKALSGERAITVDQAEEKIRALEAIGTEKVIVGMSSPEDPSVYPLWAELIARLGD